MNINELKKHISSLRKNREIPQLAKIISDYSKQEHSVIKEITVEQAHGFCIRYLNLRTSEFIRQLRITY